MRPFRNSHTCLRINARWRLCRLRCVAKTVMTTNNHKVHKEEQENEELVHIHRDQVQVIEGDAATRKIN